MIDVSGRPVPPRVDPTLFYKMVLDGCLADIVFKSRAQQWCSQRPGTDGLDFLWAVLAPARNGDNPLRFTTVGSAVAFVLAQQVPDEPSPAAKEREQAEVLIRSIE